MGTAGRVLVFTLQTRRLNFKISLFGLVCYTKKSHHLQCIISYERQFKLQIPHLKFTSQLMRLGK